MSGKKKIPTDTTKEPENDLDTLRAGMRMSMLEKMRPGDHKSHNDVLTDLIVAFENAVFDKVQLSTNPQKISTTSTKAAIKKSIMTEKLRREIAESLRTAYIREATAASRALSAPFGPYPDTTLATALIHGEIESKDAVDDKILSKKDHPPDVCRRLLVGALLKYTNDRTRVLSL